MASVLFRLSGPFTPATASEDFSERIGPGQIPQMIGFTYWVATPGGVLAGAVLMSWRWTDIQGQTRTLDGGAINLQDAASAQSVPPGVMTRQAGDSDVFLDVTLSGVADGAEIAYCIIMGPGDQEGQIGF